MAFEIDSTQLFTPMIPVGMFRSDDVFWTLYRCCLLESRRNQHPQPACRLTPFGTYLVHDRMIYGPGKASMCGPRENVWNGLKNEHCNCAKTCGGFNSRACHSTRIQIFACFELGPASRHHRRIAIPVEKHEAWARARATSNLWWSRLWARAAAAATPRNSDFLAASFWCGR